MKSPSFTLKKDWYLETDILGIKNKTLIFTKGQIFKPNENGEYHIIHGGWSEKNPNIGGRMILLEEDMKLANDNGEILFDIIVEKDMNLKIEEISEDDENVERNWRIQLDVKTTRKKLKEIQKIIEEKVKPIL